MSSTDGLLITFIDKPMVGGVQAPISDRQVLTTLDVRDTAMTYQLQDSDDSTNTTTIVLDFTATPAAGIHFRWVPSWLARLSTAARLLTLTFCVLFGIVFSGCGGGGSSTTTPANFPGALACNTGILHAGQVSSCTITMTAGAPGGALSISLQSSNTSLLTVPASATVNVPQPSFTSCCHGTPQDGYAITGYEYDISCSPTDVTVQSMCIQTRYVDKNIGATMEVCPFPPPPDNTWSVQGTDNATLACMTSTLQSPPPSAYIMQKQTGSPVAPPSVSFNASAAGSVPGSQSVTITATLNQTSTTAAITVSP